MKFTPQDGSIIVTTSERSIAGEPWGEVSVSDNGPGIPEAEHAAIFEPYYRSEATMRAPGVGLGLAISRALLQQMGGELELKGDLGVGSSFTIRLPLVRETRALK